MSARAGQVAAALLFELQCDEQIIAAMLNAMTPQQKSKIHAKLCAAGIADEGMTRANERHAVIETAEVALAELAGATAPAGASSIQEISQQAGDIEMQTLYIGILLGAVVDRLDDMTGLSAEASEAVRAADCFVMCAQRAASLIKEAGSNILSLTAAAEGGAA